MDVVTFGMLNSKIESILSGIASHSTSGNILHLIFNDGTTADITFPEPVSPTAVVSKDGKVSTLTVSDANGSTEVQINDGEKGDRGERGEKGDPGSANLGNVAVSQFTIYVNEWVESNIEKYNYMAFIQENAITDEIAADIIFSIDCEDICTEAEISNKAVTVDGGVYIYANNIPTSNIFGAVISYGDANNKEVG